MLLSFDRLRIEGSKLFQSQDLMIESAPGSSLGLKHGASSARIQWEWVRTLRAAHGFLLLPGAHAASECATQRKPNITLVTAVFPGSDSWRRELFGESGWWSPVVQGARNKKLPPGQHVQEMPQA
jgi:hypothetical protein